MLYLFYLANVKIYAYVRDFNHRFVSKYVYMLVAQSCLTLDDPRDCSPPGSSVHGILQTRILEWVTFPFSRRSSQPKERTQGSCIAGRFFYWATREALYLKVNMFFYSSTLNFLIKLVCRKLVHRSIWRNTHPYKLLRNSTYVCSSKSFPHH